MRVNVDSHFFGDKRIDRLAALCQESPLTTRGRLIQVYHYQYTQRREIASAEETDLHAEWTGTTHFGELMAQAYLARRTPEGTFEICGIRDRIKYLLEASENGRKSARVRKEKYGSNQPTKGPSKVPSDKPSTPPKVFEPLNPDQDLDPDDDQKATPAGPAVGAHKLNFEELYQKYPRKTGKKRGMAILRRTVKTQAKFDEVSGAVDRYNTHLIREKTESKYVKGFDSFLGSWEDWTEPNAGTVNLLQPTTQYDFEARQCS